MHRHKEGCCLEHFQYDLQEVGKEQIKPYTLFKKYFVEVGSEFLSCCVLRECNLGFLDGWLKDLLSLPDDLWKWRSHLWKVTSRLSCVSSRRCSAAVSG